MEETLNRTALEVDEVQPLDVHHDGLIHDVSLGDDVQLDVPLDGGYEVPLALDGDAGLIHDVSLGSGPNGVQTGCSNNFDLNLDDDMKL